MYEQTHFLSRDILHKQLQLLFQNARIQMRLKPALNQFVLDLHPRFLSQAMIYPLKSIFNHFSSISDS